MEILYLGFSTMNLCLIKIWILAWKIRLNGISTKNLNFFKKFCKSILLDLFLTNVLGNFTFAKLLKTGLILETLRLQDFPSLTEIGLFDYRTKLLMNFC